jgi:hypothetical protein
MSWHGEIVGRILFWVTTTAGCSCTLWVRHSKVKRHGGQAPRKAEPDMGFEPPSKKSKSSFLLGKLGTAGALICMAIRPGRLGLLGFAWG